MAEINENVNIPGTIETQTEVGVPGTIETETEVELPVTREMTRDVEMPGEIEVEVTVDVSDTASAYNAEAWAVGQRGGVPVAETDETYQNNAKYYAQLTADPVVALVAPDYSNLSFPVYAGTKCTYENEYYYAKQIIQSRETFDPTHWKKTTVGQEIAPLQKAKVPDSGSTGQVLKKRTNGDYAMEWGDAGNVNWLFSFSGDVSNDTDYEMIQYETTAGDYSNKKLVIINAYFSDETAVASDVEVTGSAYGADIQFSIRPHSTINYLIGIGEVTGTAYTPGRKVNTGHGYGDQILALQSGKVNVSDIATIAQTQAIISEYGT